VDLKNTGISILIIRILFYVIDVDIGNGLEFTNNHKVDND